MFTTVHRHLLLSHLPRIVPGVALVLLGVGLWRRDELLARVGATDRRDRPRRWRAR